MDATNDTSAVPVDSNGNVFSKVSRISLGGLTLVSKSNQSQQRVAPQPQPTEILLSTSPKAETQSVAQPVEPKTRERRNSDKLLSFDNFDEPIPTQPGLLVVAYGL